MTDRENECSQNRTSDVDADEHRRHIAGISAHPRDWAIIIGGSYSEHDSIIAPVLADASKQALQKKKFSLGDEARRGENYSFVPSQDRHLARSTITA